MINEKKMFSLLDFFVSENNCVSWSVAFNSKFVVLVKGVLWK